MSRHRALERYAPRIVSDQYYAGTAYVVGNYSHLMLGQDYASSMDDELTPVGARRMVNPCTHTRGWGTNFSVSTYINYVGNPPQQVLNYKLCARPSFDLAYQLPAGDWAGLASKLADQLNGRINEGSLIGVSALEAAKTVAMIRNPFNLLKPSWRRHAAGHTAKSLSRGKAALKNASNIWLEHRYGWNALWQDIKAVAKTTAKIAADMGPIDDGDGLDSITNKEEFVGIFGDTIYSPSDSQTYWAPWYVDNWPNISVTSHMRARLRTTFSRGVYRVGCKQSVDAAIRWSRAKRLINAYGLDASSIAATLWEIVPFSFVVDWFIDPLGIWHAPSVRQRLHSSDVRDLCATLKIEARFAVDILLVGNPFGNTPMWGYRTTQSWGKGLFEGAGTMEFHRFTRTTDIPPSGGFSSVFTNKDLSLIQRISGTALLAQKFVK